MIVEETFAITPVGVGRKDYSQNVEFSVEPVIRSHLMRTVWAAEYTLPTVPYPNAYAGILIFHDLAGTVLNYVPSDIKYIIYDIGMSGDYNALLAAALYKLTYPGFALIETIAEVFGYGQATINLTKGHKCEPGRAYVVPLAVWSEEPSFTESMLVFAVSDVVVG